MKKTTGDWYCSMCCEPLETGDVTIRFGRDGDILHFKCVYQRADVGIRGMFRSMLHGVSVAPYEDEEGR